MHYLTTCVLSPVLVDTRKGLLMIEGTVLLRDIRRDTRSGWHIYHPTQSLQDMLELAMRIRTENAENTQGI